jgi:cell division protein FtsW (lipid II flippase)
MNQILSNVKGDRWIWLIVILLSVISMLAVYSSTVRWPTNRVKQPSWIYNEAPADDSDGYSADVYFASAGLPVLRGYLKNIDGHNHSPVTIIHCSLVAISTTQAAG